jgi:hypothetical protein
MRLDRNVPPETDILDPQRKIISLYRFGTARNNHLTVNFGPGTIPGISGTETFSSATHLFNFISYGQAAYYPERIVSNWFGADLSANHRRQFAPIATGFHNRNWHSTTTDYTGSNPWGWKIYYGLNRQIPANVNMLNERAMTWFGQRVKYIGPDYPKDW